MEPPIIPRKARGIIQDVILAIVDDLHISNENISKQTGHPIKIIQHIRKSDSFRSMLAKAQEMRYGEVLQTVRLTQMTTAVNTLKSMSNMAGDPGILPLARLEAAKIVMDTHNKTEERLIPKVAPGPQNQVNLTISLEDLQSARQASLTQGQEIVLEPSDASHAPAIPGQFQEYHVANGHKERLPVRVEGK